MPHVTVIEAKTSADQATHQTMALERKRKVAGYARVSTDRDEQFTSYEAQVEYYKRMIESREDWELVNIYTDEGITGTSTKRRTGFRTMVRDALAGKIDLIVTKSVSRFARNTVDSLVTIRKLKEHGTEIFFEKENIWTFDSKGELLITIMSSLAQEESRSISENVTWGMRESMRQGKAWVPYKVFLGYDKGPNGQMVINPKQAVLVRRIYCMYLQGYSPYHIGKILEEEGVEFSEGQKKWYGSTIKSILTNEKYKGDALRQKTFSVDYLTKERVKNNGELQRFYISNHHEAIISSELFDKVQFEIHRRGMKEIPHGGSKVFSKRVKCADCGSWFGETVWAPHTVHEKKVWRCIRKYAKGKKHCKPPAVTEELLKKAFIKAMNIYLFQKEMILSAFSAYKTEKFNDAGLLAERNELYQEIQLIAQAFQSAPAESLEHFNARLDIAEERLYEVNQQLEEIRLMRIEADCFIEEVDKLEAIFEFDNQLFYKLVDYMTVKDKNSFDVFFRDGTTIST